MVIFDDNQLMREVEKLNKNPLILNHPNLKYERPILFIPTGPTKFYEDSQLKNYVEAYRKWDEDPSQENLDAFVERVNEVTGAYKSNSGVKLSPEEKAAYAKRLEEEQIRRYGRPGAWWESPIIGGNNRSGTTQDMQNLISTYAPQLMPNYSSASGDSSFYNTYIPNYSSDSSATQIYNTSPSPARLSAPSPVRTSTSAINNAIVTANNPVSPMLNTRPSSTPTPMGTSSLAQSYARRFQPMYSPFPNYYPNRPNPFRNRQSIF